MGDVIDFTGLEVIDESSNDILGMAKDHFSDLLIVGWDTDDKLSLRTSIDDFKEVIYLLEQAKFTLLNRQHNIPPTEDY
jgi:hypothetical protein